MPEQQRNRTRSFPINIRTWPTLGERLKSAAEDGGLTMTQEVERRLKASFLSDREDVGRLSSAVVTALDYANKLTGNDWAADRLTALVAQHLVENAMDRFVKQPDNLDELSQVYADLEMREQRQKNDVQVLLGAGALESREPNALLQFAGFPSGMFGKSKGTPPSHPFDRLFAPFRLTPAALVAVGKHANGEDLPEGVREIVELLEMAAENVRAIEALNSEIQRLGAEDWEIREKAFEIIRAASRQPTKVQADDQEV